MHTCGILPPYLGSSQQVSPRFGTSDNGTPRATQEVDSAFDVSDHADFAKHSGVDAHYGHLVDKHTFAVEQCEPKAEEEPEREDRGSLSKSSPAESPLCQQSAVTSLLEAVADNHHTSSDHFMPTNTASSAMATLRAVVHTGSPPISALESAMATNSGNASLQREATDRQLTMPTSVPNSSTNATSQSHHVCSTSQHPPPPETIEQHRPISAKNTATSPENASPPLSPARSTEQPPTLREAVQGCEKATPTSPTLSPLSTMQLPLSAPSAGQLSTGRASVHERHTIIPASARASAEIETQPSTPAYLNGQAADASVSPTRATQQPSPTHVVGPFLKEHEATHVHRQTISTSAALSPSSATQPFPPAHPGGHLETEHEVVHGRCPTISTTATLGSSGTTQPCPQTLPVGHLSAEHEAAIRHSTRSTSPTTRAARASQQSSSDFPVGQPSTLREAAQGRRLTTSTSVSPSPASAAHPSPLVHPPGHPSTLREAAQEHSRRTANGYTTEATDAHQHNVPRMRRSWSDLPPAGARSDGAPRSCSHLASQDANRASQTAGSEDARIDRYVDEFGDEFYDVDDHDVWGGWTCVVNECRMFYYHEEKNITQWECPPDLYPILGEWKPVKTGHADSVFWHNATVNLSLWSDPTKTYDCFEAALKGNVWFLHVYNQLGGNLRYQHPTTKATVLHYAMCGGSAACVHYLLANLPEGAVNDVDLDDNSALIYGVRYGYWNLCKLFADARCSAAVATKAYDLALELGSDECAKVLGKIVNRRVSLANEKDVADPSPSKISATRRYIWWNREAPREDASGGTLFSQFMTALASMIRPRLIFDAERKYT